MLGPNVGQKRNQLAWLAREQNIKCVLKQNSQIVFFCYYDFSPHIDIITNQKYW